MGRATSWIYNTQLLVFLPWHTSNSGEGRSLLVVPHVLKKIFFAASCDCETSALLSVEISEEKDDNEIQAAIPSLVDRLERQERSFRMMDCGTHSKMRTGFHKD